ncbi:MAG: hypothetical protein LBG48_05880 [Rickettsiales bacterium]|jgi:hypothetical protein|nr:hypothetical protein [Rickettsiales bacterium]
MVTKSLPQNTLASATSVTFKQQVQSTGAFARDERILVIGNYQEGKSVIGNINLPKNSCVLLLDDYTPKQDFINFK